MTANKRRMAAALVLMLAILTLGACATTQPFRLHIKANSDSDADQRVKLAVRDAVLSASEDIAMCENEQEAEEYIENNLEIILKTANDTLKQSGFNYTASARLGRFRFPEKSYRGVSYPEGEYDALSITLGEGKGDNWWCVMFPPLCLSEAEDTEDTEYTSIFAELWEAIFKG